MGQALLGIEIGNCNIKAVQGIQKRNELVLTNYGIEPTPKGAVWDGFIMDMDALLHSL
ncbi:MAG: Type pilus assembly protein PilM, partial [Defluviitaleaceae bacterium]|nr:Type pilus assembly protein PilM [Defluviitaleaceae bacterium]